MALHRYRALAQGLAAGHASLEGREEGEEFEHDYGQDVERAVVAAGWVERVDDDEAPKGGKK